MHRQPISSCLFFLFCFFATNASQFFNLLAIFCLIFSEESMSRFQFTTQAFFLSLSHGTSATLVCDLVARLRRTTNQISDVATALGKREMDVDVDVSHRNVHGTRQERRAVRDLERTHHQTCRPIAESNKELLGGHERIAEQFTKATRFARLLEEFVEALRSWETRKIKCGLRTQGRVPDTRAAAFNKVPPELRSAVGMAAFAWNRVSDGRLCLADEAYSNCGA